MVQCKLDGLPVHCREPCKRVYTHSFTSKGSFAWPVPHGVNMLLIRPSRILRSFIDLYLGPISVNVWCRLDDLFSICLFLFF